MRILLLSFVVFLSAACSTVPSASATLTGLDTFGSKRLSAEDISARYGDRIEKWVLLGKRENPDFEIQRDEIETAIKNEFGFSYVALSWIGYFAPEVGDYVTVDVVEPEDQRARMTFLPEPKGKFDDPDGLIALWEQYLQLGFRLQRAGKFEFAKSCPAWHCTHGFENVELTPFLEKFNKLVPPNEKKLVKILKEDARRQFRGNAIFLLAHIKDGDALIKYALGSVEDPDEIVRNNAVRVLSDISMRHPEKDIPIQPILKVLNYPTATDRNKAGYTLVNLSTQPKHKKVILESSGQILLEMLKLQQPNNHQPAYQILKNISGEKFGEHDYDAWEKWLHANSAPSKN